MNDTTRVWLITGCSSGFGKAIAEQVLAAGDCLIATARRVETLAGLVAMAPERCGAFALDVTESAQITHVLQAATARWARLDVVVNNAGYGLVGALEECSDEQIQRCFAVNFFGALNVMRAALPTLRAQRSGHLVNISAAAAISNYAGFGVYGAAKAALEMASESVRVEVASLGIKVTLVQPGPFRTDFIGRSLERGAERIADYDASSGKFLAFLEKIDGQQPGDPVRVAKIIVEMVRSGDAPLRLPLGKYVVKKIRDKAAATTREVERLAALAESADF